MYKLIIALNLGYRTLSDDTTIQLVIYIEVRRVTVSRLCPVARGYYIYYVYIVTDSEPNGMK